MSGADEVVNEAIATTARARRYHRLEWIIVLCTALIVVVAIAVGIYFGARQNQIRDFERQQSCVARLTAEFQGAVASALAAPPAPNAARTQAVSEIITASQRLLHLDRVCR